MRKRKCSHCKSAIEIDDQNISDVVIYQGKYYHLKCFEELATKRAASKRGKPTEWQTALNNMAQLEADAKTILEYSFTRDKLNEWLLAHYDVVTVPSPFWYIVTDLENGVFGKDKCNPVPISVLFAMWQWGQSRLDKIAAQNKANHTGPKGDTERLRYDLAILMRHYSDYKKHVKQEAALEAEMLQRQKEEPKINYNKIKSTNNNSDGLDDISDLLDLI